MLLVKSLHIALKSGTFFIGRKSKKFLGHCSFYAYQATHLRPR